MTQTGRKTTVVLVAAMAMMVAGGVDAQDEPISPDVQDPTIVLHAVNYAVLSPDILDDAKARVAKVYELIGVRIVWVDGEVSPEERQDGRFHLSILLLSREMTKKVTSPDDISNNVLGRAHVTGRRAQIFCDRIATTPGALQHFFSILLANIIAHEVGHLLLGTNSHSRSGIMRAHADVRALHVQSFDKAQAETIRMRLKESARSARR